jgi:hypothetical protein
VADPIEECVERVHQRMRPVARTYTGRELIEAGVREGMRWALHRIPLDLVCTVCKRVLTGCLGDRCICNGPMVLKDAELRALAGEE